MNEEKEIGLSQIFMLLLCLYVLIAMACSTFAELSIETNKLLETIDIIICFIFIGDFLCNLYKAESKLQFLKWGWIDLISSIPTIGILRWGRLFRIARILRVLRGIRSIKFLLRFIFENKAKGGFFSISVISIMMIIFSSIAILQVETCDDSNIKTAKDALWWSFVTITTVGYGDFYPVSIEGRIIASILMIIGIGFFGTLAGFVSSLLVGNDDDSDNKELLSEIKELKILLRGRV